MVSYGLDGVLTNEHFEQGQPSYVVFLNQQGTKGAVIFDFQNQMQRFISEQAAAAAASGQSGYPTTLKDLPSFCQLCFCTGGSPNYTKVCYTGGGTGGVELHEFVTR